MINEFMIAFSVGYGIYHAANGSYLYAACLFALAVYIYATDRII